MEKLTQGIFTGERALFKAQDLSITDSIFDDGESPLKESRNIVVADSSFKWKYPLWYSRDIRVERCLFFEMARAGIWYTSDIFMKDIVFEAPKALRRCSGLQLENVTFHNASETLWNCSGISLRNVTARGDYFAMGSRNIKADNLELVGNYGFDGCTDIEISGARLLTKDAFWNCRNVTVRDSVIVGEYLGWNSENVTFINCTIESLQGMCYMKNVVMKDCKLINTTLSFEYSTADAQIVNTIDSVKNPSGGVIRAKAIKELIMDENDVDINATRIITEE